LHGQAVGRSWQILLLFAALELGIAPHTELYVNGFTLLRPLKAMQATIVVPCYNEAKRLQGQIFLDFIRQQGNIHFLFVNDGSTDGTLELLTTLKERDPARIDVLSLEQNSGKAEAVRQGMLWAIEHGAEYAAYWDADLATPLEEIVEFRNVLDSEPRTVLVMGSRIRLLGRDIERTATRHLLGRSFASAASLTLKLKVYDTQCGAKMFRVDADIHQIFKDRFCSRWIFDVELLARMIAQSQDGNLLPAEDIICEWPIRRWKDVQGSKLKPFDFVLAFKELFVILRKYRPYFKQKNLTKPAVAQPAAFPEVELPQDDHRKAA